MAILVGLLIAAAGLYVWFAIRDALARTNATQKHLARLLLVCGRAFYDQNEELYAATIREIINVIREARWKRAEIEWKIRHALSIARGMSSPENFDKASRMAQTIIQAST